MLQHLSRTSARANASRKAFRNALTSRLASTQAIDTSEPHDENQGAIWTAHVRAWRPPNRISETLLIIAEIEKRYGKIRETIFLKDYEMHHKTQMLAYVIFEDPESVKRIPRGGIDHTVESTTMDATESHSLSLQDVEALVYPTTSATVPANKAAADNGKVLGFRLIVSEKDYVDPKHSAAFANRIFQATPGTVMESFYTWGGFHSGEPLELPSEQFANDELFDPQQVQSDVRMRAALKLCEANRKQPRMVEPQTDSPTPTPPSSKSTVQPPTPVAVQGSTATLEKPSPSPQTSSKVKKSKSATPADPAPPVHPTPPSIPEVKKPELSEGQKADLADQLKAARNMRKAAQDLKKSIVESKFPAVVIPPSLELHTRRKQAKPRPVRTYIDMREASPKADASEQTSTGGGILGRLKSFIGGKS